VSARSTLALVRYEVLVSTSAIFDSHRMLTDSLAYPELLEVASSACVTRRVDSSLAFAAPFKLFETWVASLGFSSRSNMTSESAMAPIVVVWNLVGKSTVPSAMMLVRAVEWSVASWVSLKIKGDCREECP
jgi:hypothetical protein